VNGKVVTDANQWVDLDRDKVSLDGRPVREGPKVYLLFYKPKGYLTTARDPEGRPTIYDLLTDLKERVIPVGRLDLETSGLLLATSDTQFAERITNPDYKIPKTYLVKAASRLSEEDLDRLRKGVELSDGPTRPAEVRHLREAGGKTIFEIVITEGRNRQVRRMVEAVGSKVLKLVRTAIGPLEIAGLPIGKYRYLTNEEVQTLIQGARKRIAPASGMQKPPAPGSRHKVKSRPARAPRGKRA
jgi:23S rRNA pseudouridine2605 synthase